jgi:hypothetical protein
LDTIESRKKGYLTRKQRWGVLAFLVGLPYIRIKAQQHFEDLRNEDHGTSSETRVSDCFI